MSTLRLELRPSRTLAAGLAVAHATAAACVLVVLPGFVGLALALLLVCLGGAVAWDRALLRGRHSVKALELGRDGEIALELADGRRVAGRATARRHVGRWWVILPRPDRAGRHLIALPDMLTAEEFRRLRLWALWGRLPGRARTVAAA